MDLHKVLIPCLPALFTLIDVILTSSALIYRQTYYQCFEKESSLRSCSQHCTLYSMEQGVSQLSCGIECTQATGCTSYRYTYKDNVCILCMANETVVTEHMLYKSDTAPPGDIHCETKDDSCCSGNDDKKHCTAMTCNNGGTCVQQSPSYKCICRANFTGQHCQVPLLWPSGSYGLVRPNATCLSGNLTGNNPCPFGNWATGWRQHDTDDGRNNNSVTQPNCIELELNRESIKWQFCMKLDEPSDVNWPAGSYCLFKKGNCPNGFEKGTILYDDEDYNNLNFLGGVLPDGVYNKNTEYHFCCRNDSGSATEIHLPTQVPFYLIAVVEQCQKVYGMTLRPDDLLWDCENANSAQATTGLHPYIFGLTTDVKLRLCYYSPQ